MMKGRIASIIFAGAGLICCSNAWAWTMVGDKVKFSDAELNVCRLFEHDAAVVYLNRQEGYPLDFDDRFTPTLIQKRARANMISEAKTIPIESDPEKRMAAGEQFTKRFLGKCFRFFYETDPPGRYIRVLLPFCIQPPVIRSGRTKEERHADLGGCGGLIDALAGGLSAAPGA